MDALNVFVLVVGFLLLFGGCLALWRFAKLRSKGTPRVNSNDIGLAILEPLRDLDEVGYLRFASVYKSFSSAQDFENEILSLRNGDA